jgi:hypothetical protein
MKSIPRRTLAAYLVGGLSLVSFSHPARATQAAAPARAERYRKPVPGERIQAGCARVAVNVRLEAVRKVVTDFDRYASFIKRTKDGKLQLQITAKAVGRKGDKQDVYLEVPVLKGTAKVWGLLRFDPIKVVDGEEVLEGKLIKGNVHRLDARWRLRKLADDKTAVHLELLIIPKVPVPADVLTGELEFVSDVAVTGARDESERRNRAK